MFTNFTSNAAPRCLVLGRNNNFGSKSKRGTEVAAMFYSLIESAKMNDLDPGAYLRHGAAAFLRGERVPLPHELREAGIILTRLSPPGGSSDRGRRRKLKLASSP